jgi:hypothetical protein
MQKVALPIFANSAFLKFNEKKKRKERKENRKLRKGKKQCKTENSKVFCFFFRVISCNFAAKFIWLDCLTQSAPRIGKRSIVAGICYNSLFANFF